MSRSFRHIRTVYVSDADARFPSVIDELADAMRAQACTPLLGAGISLPPPARMPLGQHLESELRTTLWQSVGEFEQHCSVPPPARVAAQDVIHSARLERILDALQQTHGPEPVREFLSVLRAREWNRNHAAIACLAVAGYVRHCVTLNFDLLIEEAVVAQGGSTHTVCPLSRGTGFYMPARSNAPTLQVVKPHGSLTPADDPASEFQLLSPTLADVGNQPDARNVARLNSCWATGRSVLSAGYSDHDWDVFPVLQAAAPSLSHIYWIAYLPPEGVEERHRPEGVGSSRIERLLATCNGRGTLLLGDPETLLLRVCNRLRLGAPVPDLLVKPGWNVRRPPTEQFLSGAREVFATAVAFALLLQDRGRFHRSLVRWLLDQGLSRELPLLASRLHRTAAHACHTSRDLRGARRHMQLCVTLKRDAANAGGIRANIADELVWMGYERLCLIKRPSWRWLLGAPVPYHWCGGVRLMNRGLFYAHDLPRRERRKLRAMTRFYRGDLLQSWAMLAFLLGRHLRPVTRGLMRRAVMWYEQAGRIDPSGMAWEYYWLRTLEARLFGGLGVGDTKAIASRIEEIDWSYAILQNHVQRGNTLAYQALFGACPPAEAADLLRRAEELWSDEDGFVASGLLRVIIYRRALRLTGPAVTIRELLRLRQRIRKRHRERR